MKILGLTGPSGSGKGFLANIFYSFGIPYLDTDAVYHGLVSSPSLCTRELETVFGDFVLNDDGSLNRKKMAAYVFSGDNQQEERLATLNRITHRYVLDEVRVWLNQRAKEGYKAAIIDAPLLYESGFDKQCDFVIAVLAPRKLRLARIIKRDGMDELSALSRLNAQPSDTFYRERADFIIDNDADEAKAIAKAEKILAFLGL